MQDFKGRWPKGRPLERHPALCFDFPTETCPDIYVRKNTVVRIIGKAGGQAFRPVCIPLYPQGMVPYAETYEMIRSGGGFAVVPRIQQLSPG